MYNQVESVKGRKLAYCRSGDWQDEVIVFFHGFVGSKAYCLEAGSCCLVSFERFGSQVVPYYSMEDFIECVYEILKRHKVRSVKLIGHSAGGYYVQLFAQHFPDMITSLTLVSNLIPISCVDYLESHYSVTKKHILDDLGHMLYLVH
ncbi:MAG: alpha/beta hydrolase [Streptococcus hyointestinalis]|nr:alpha/beta hydrolase [Streptococcus hyointestinalis]MDD6385446.1 alpha/beta hydrolase [Streptococcus hyointestinalis]